MRQPTPGPGFARPVADPVFAPTPGSGFAPPVDRGGVAMPVAPPVDPDWDLVERKPWEGEDRTDVVPTAPRRRSRVAVFVTLGVVAVVAGVVIGVLSGGDDTAPIAGPTSTPAPTTTTTAAPTTTGATPAGSDPRFAPTITRLADDGTTIEVIWTDPTGGGLQFVLIDVTDLNSTPKPVVTVAAGSTSHTVTGLDPKAARYCYQVIGIGVADQGNRGVSPRTCAERN